MPITRAAYDGVAVLARPMKFLLAIFVLLLLPLSPPASAQTQRPVVPRHPWALSQWQRKVWQIEDGLPSNYVTAVAQSPSGRLLIGTKSGLVTFDGFSFAPVTTLRDIWITCLVQSPDGSLWAGTHDDGLFHIDGAHATQVATGSFFSLALTPGNRILAVSALGAGFANAQGFTVTLPGTVTDDYGWQPAAVTPDGALWFAATSGLSQFLNGKPTAVRVIGSTGTPVTVANADDVTLYLGTTTGLFRLTCAGATCNARAVPGVLGPVVGLRRVSDHSLWIATWGHGIFHLSELDGIDHVDSMDSRSGLADDFVRTFYEDTEKNLWAGTRGGGLTRFRTTILKPFGISEGMDGNCASAAVGDGAGGVWLGTWRSGLFHYAGGRMLPQPLPADPLRVIISSLAIDSNRNLWIGSFNELWVLRQGSATATPVPFGNSKPRIRQIFFAHDHSLWIVKLNGELLHYPSGDPNTSTSEAILPNEHVTYIAQDGSQTVWLGTATGLVRFDPTTANAIPVFHSNSPVLSINEDRRHRLWTSFEDGTVRVGDALIPFSTAGLPNKLVYKVMQDPDGNYWFSTGLGLGWLTGHDVDAALQSPTATAPQAVSMGVANGARTIECRCAQYPQSWASADGSMWVPTSKGFVAADPHRIGPRGGPTSSIESLQWDGSAPVATSSATLPAGTHNLEIHFSAVRLGTADEVTFRYRLDGLDDRWIDAGHNRFARYAQLPHGHHRFLVQARDSLGDWGPADEASLLQKPRIYQTLWFRALIIAIIPLIMVSIYMLRMRALQTRYNAVLQERGRIAREWHDTLLAGLAAVAWQLDSAITNTSEGPLHSSLANARSMLRYCSQEARMAVDGLRNQSIETGSMSHALEETLRQVTLGTQVRFDVRVSPAVPALSVEIRQALTRICQEASSNAIRHGKPSRLNVTLDCDESTVILSIADDGLGMNPAFLETSPPGHFGILGMKERVQRIGGTLKITTTPLKGTTVRAMVPVIV